jgi:photosystem II stability/assembly factor-like uncharacterized protein
LDGDFYNVSANLGIIQVWHKRGGLPMLWVGLKRLACLGGSIVMLLALSSCAWQLPGSQRLCATPTPEQDAGCLNHGKSIGAWQGLRMFDASDGWASTYAAILHTSDGGQHWKNVTPWQTFSSWGHTWTFIDANVAWVLQQRAPDKNLPAQIFRTQDGGRTWRSASLPDTGELAPSRSTDIAASGVFAADGQSGWVAVRGIYYPPDDPDNIQVSFVHVWRTLDGGKQWALALDALPLNTLRQVPPGGSLWVTFPSSQAGFMSEVRPQSILVTSDAGFTWQRQILPPIDQTNISSGTIIMHTPTFLSPSDGIIPVTAIHREDGRFVNVYYVTHDGGANWQPTPPLVLSSLQGTDFITAAHWAVFDENGVLYQTHDGGQTWSQAKVTSSFRRLNGVHFLSPTEAWGIGDNDTYREGFKGAQSDLTVPVRSSDGGITWRAITPYSVA